jgi:uncharacterized protein HemX
MAVRGTTLGVLLLVVVLAAACGASSGAKTKMQAKFQQIDFRMGSMETLNASNDPNLQRATRQYIALVRHYGAQLGRTEAKRRLMQKAAEVSPYCLPCQATLEDEAKRY